jgi:hypothetical protein
MSHRLLVILFLLIVPVVLFSQETQVDVVYLKNGTFLRGKIIELIPDSSLKILLTGMDTLAIDMGDVKVIRKESLPVFEKAGYEDDVKVWGYTNITELSIGFGLAEGLDRYRDTAVGVGSVLLTTFNGFTFSPAIQLGIGAGIELWRSRGFLPFYLDLRSNILKRNNSPFFYVNVGYALGWMKGQAGMGFGGATAGVGAGVKVKVNKRRIMVFSLGYRFQQTRQWITTYGVETKATLDSHFMNLRVGGLF